MEKQAKPSSVVGLMFLLLIVVSACTEVYAMLEGANCGAQYPNNPIAQRQCMNEGLSRVEEVDKANK